MKAANVFTDLSEAERFQLAVGLLREMPVSWRYEAISELGRSLPIELPNQIEDVKLSQALHPVTLPAYREMAKPRMSWHGILSGFVATLLLVMLFGAIAVTVLHWTGRL